MRTKSYREFFVEIDFYERQCRVRNRIVVVLFCLALVPALLVLASLSSSPIGPVLRALPNWIGNVALVTTLVLVTFVGVYVLVSSSKFHKAAAPKCEACGKSIGALDEITLANWRLADVPIRIHCKGCGYLMASWN